MRIGNVLERDAGPLPEETERPVNLLRAELIERLEIPVLAVHGQEVPVPGLLRLRSSLRRHLGRPVIIGVRPEHLQDALVGRPDAAGPAVIVLHGVVRSARPDGADLLVRIELADAADGRDPAPTLVARVSGRSRAAAGEPIMLAVDARHLHMYDAVSGHSLW
ncbi:TOBE domain-containing protein [Dactylosporangium sp. NPDC050688]|uniref:TOBE domain-containing protein n=1 Tax=Dactylosporangium sp. NPDC050688 TaxID=3157217 RepID=UPI0033DFC499